MHTKRRDTMRQIEQQMCNSIVNQTDWRKDNTRVETIKYNDTYVCSNVYLHNNLIATVGTNQVEIYDGAWAISSGPLSLYIGTSCLSILILSLISCI